MIDGVEAIDAGWLQSVFAAQGISAPDLAILDVSPIGQGNLGAVVRVRLTSNSSKLPASVVCKLTSASAETGAFAQAYGAYLREALSYQQVLHSQICRVPHCYFVAVSPDGLGFNLVMEDLSHARPGDQVAGCSLAEADSALTELANLHRAHWNDTRASKLDWLVNPRGPFAAMTHESYAQGVAQFRQRYADQLGSRYMSAIERIAPRVGEWSAMVTERNAICHNDARVDNFMFVDRPDGAVEAVILDWQFTSYRNPLFDVAYFLTGSISIEERRTHEKDLLRKYFEQVREAGMALTYDQILADYRQQLISGLVATVGSSTVIPPGQRDALLMALATRNCAAVLDWDFI